MSTKPRMAFGSMESRSPFLPVEDAAVLLGISAFVLTDVVAAGGFKQLRSPNGGVLLLRSQVEELKVELRESKRRERWSEGR